MLRHVIITAAVGAALALPSSLLAQPIDSFLIGSNPAEGEYAAGQVLGQSPSILGWTGAWNDGFQGNAWQTTETGLTYSTIPAEGGAIQTLASGSPFEGRIGRTLSTPVTGDSNRTLYMSFLMQATTATNGAQITYGGLELHNANGLGDGDRQFQIVVGENIDGVSQTPNYSVSLFNSDLGGGFAGDLGVNDELTNLFVAKFDLSDVNDADAVTVWRNPENLADESLSTVDFSATGFNININATSFARFGIAGDFTYDELRLGSTYESVTSVVPDFVLGDTSGNGFVELADFDPIRDNWLESNASFGSTLSRMDGDLNLNGIVSIEDFREWKDAFLASGGSASAVQSAFASLSVPEPSAAAMLLVGLAAAARIGRRRG
ncbi:hypothetical protein KOR34_46790 [Posidoniimonas corsicana]|uniref:Ice-binding protein C-terminal domain-containing protein n=1 Tax=Posidoniimonas corsicana TaxID=1938618 RepID=A0A5C5V049_9BACT|nr:PEP-CTERM sorting domain-containing protein [Posidoniimonas corsicana]TWT31303.1 hypothetical protein KOR34_46790 [Posidoniimonas corsicana]